MMYSTPNIPVTHEILAFTDRPSQLYTFVKADEFVSLWEEEKNTFKVDPLTALITCSHGGETHETMVIITDAFAYADGTAISYDLTYEGGDQMHEIMTFVSFFIQSGP